MNMIGLYEVSVSPPNAKPGDCSALVAAGDNVEAFSPYMV